MEEMHTPPKVAARIVAELKEWKDRTYFNMKKNSLSIPEMVITDGIIEQIAHNTKLLILQPVGVLMQYASHQKFLDSKIPSIIRWATYPWFIKGEDIVINIITKIWYEMQEEVENDMKVAKDAQNKESYLEWNGSPWTPGAEL